MTYRLGRKRKKVDRSGNCVVCGMWRQVLCRDHKIPRSQGGANDPSNIQFLCGNCHQDKSSLEISAVHKGRPKSPEHRKKIAMGNRRRMISDETKAKLSASATEAWKVLKSKGQNKLPSLKVGRSGDCVLCGTWRRVLCRDHKIPRREGGSNDPSNIQLICSNCHQSKTALEQSAAHKGRPKSLEQIAKIVAKNTGRTMPLQQRAKIRASVLESMADPKLRKYLRKRAKERIARIGPPCMHWKTGGPNKIANSSKTF